MSEHSRTVILIGPYPVREELCAYKRLKALNLHMGSLNEYYSHFFIRVPQDGPVIVAEMKYNINMGTVWKLKKKGGA